MSLRPIKIPEIRALSAKTSTDVRGAIEDIRGFLRQLRGRGGVVAAQDMVDAGMLSPAGNALVPVVDLPTPLIVENFTATGAFRTIQLAWDAARYAVLYEVYRNTEDVLGTAVKIGTTTATLVTDTPAQASLSVTYYYWVRAVNGNGITGPWNSTVGTPASTASDPAYMIDILSRALDSVTPTINAVDLVFACESFALRMAESAPGVFEYPFIVAEIPGAPGTYGVFMNAAFIKAATITNAMIAELAADKITSGYINAARIAAGSLTASMIDSRGLSIKDSEGNVILAAGSPLGSANIAGGRGGNLLHNAGMTLSGEGFIAGSTTASGLNFTEWNIKQGGARYGTWYTNGAATGAYHAFYIGSPNLIPVIAGRRYEFYAYTGAHRLNVSCYIQFYNAAGASLGTGTAVAINGAANNAEAAGGTTLAGYKQIGVFSIAPAGAVSARFVIDGNGTEADSWLFVALPYFGEATAGQTEPSPWAEGSSGLNLVLTSANISTYIAAVAIGTALIADAAITTAKIADLAVETLKIKGSAVTVPISVTEGSVLTGNGAYQAALGILFTSGMANEDIDVIILFSGRVGYTNYPTNIPMTKYKIERVVGGTPVEIYASGDLGSVNDLPMIQAKSTVPKDTATQFYVYFYGADADVEMGARTLTILGTKR